MIYKIIGINTLEEKIYSKIHMHHKEGGAISMALVLDRSGSMNGGGRTSKITSLKLAVNTMINDFKVIDPDNKYIRMGMVSYSHNTTPNVSMGWDLSATQQATTWLRARGGTNSAPAVNWAYEQLKHPREIDEHATKNGQEPTMVMVFMTDGVNNFSSADTDTLKTCKKAKDYGMEIYTVAFQAPRRGEALLDACASSSAHYFEPQNTAELIQAFRKIGAGSAEKLRLSQ